MSNFCSFQMDADPVVIGADDELLSEKAARLEKELEDGKAQRDEYEAQLECLRKGNPLLRGYSKM